MTPGFTRRFDAADVDAWLTSDTGQEVAVVGLAWLAAALIGAAVGWAIVRRRSE
jgi:hypothetical protein